MTELGPARSLRDKVVVVTGAGSGIGRATALAVAAGGGHPIATDIHGADATAAHIREGGGMARGEALDVGDENAWARLVEQVVAEHGRIDALANVAGLAGGEDSILTQTDEGWERIMRVNLRGPWYGMRAVLPHMLAAGSGRIVNVASNVALVGMPSCFAYATSKAGLIGMSRQVAMEVADRGVRVNVVAPGIIETPMLGEAADASVTAMREMTPVQRIGTPDEVAAMIAFLCADAADFITGQVLAIDGGWTAR